MRTLPVALCGLTVPATILASRLICRDITAFVDRGAIPLDWKGCADAATPFEVGTGLAGAVLILAGPTDAMVITWALFVASFAPIAIVDHRYGLVPDRLVLPALWAGLILAAAGWGCVMSPGAIVGAAGGWVSIAAVRCLAARIFPNRRPPQLGAGDVKLAAALGAWLGLLPALAAFAGAVVVATAAALFGDTRRPRPQAFAPAFCLAAACLFALHPLTLFARGARP
jgi:leader peptidase (prepilin peptidase)/N-methyltransferase